MMKRWMRALLCLCLLLPIGAKAEGSFTDVFVFGDSLSDTGNAAAFRDVSLLEFGIQVPIGTNGLCNPFDIFAIGKGCGDLFFRQSRVSNGPVAVEILAERFGFFDELKPSLFFLPLPDLPLVPPNFPRPPAGTNYAVAGAEAGGFGAGDLAAQVIGFSFDHGFTAPPDALYVVIIGGNDIIEAVKASIDVFTGSVSDETSEAIIAAAVDAIGDNINFLIGAGARKFLVANSVNIGSVPATRIRADEEGLPRALVIGLATLLTKKFNKQLAERLDQIRAEQELIGNPVRIKEFNLFLFFEGVRLVGKFFGLNTIDLCFDSETYLDSPIAERIFHPDCAPDPGELPKFDRFVFFDDLHPTGRIHRVVGKALSAAARRLTD